MDEIDSTLETLEEHQAALTKVFTWLFRGVLVAVILIGVPLLIPMEWEGFNPAPKLPINPVTISEMIATFIGINLLLFILGCLHQCVKVCKGEEGKTGTEKMDDLFEAAGKENPYKKPDGPDPNVVRIKVR